MAALAAVLEAAAAARAEAARSPPRQPTPAPWTARSAVGGDLACGPARRGQWRQGAGPQ
ncbi:hypothetical protein GS466_05640 [Rhodococcus hoagii]|nr:hypothetical protein [Prescottella equi]